MTFPNFVCGTIVRDKAREAYEKGITADLIAMFLNKHAHEQMFIKKELDDEKQMPSGILINENPQDSSKKAVKGLMSKEVSVVPKNVIDQMHIWEEEINCISAKEGMIVYGFDNRDQFDQFKAFIRRSDIRAMSWSDKNMIYVVSVEYEKDIIEFLDRH